MEDVSKEANYPRSLQRNPTGKLKKSTFFFIKSIFFNVNNSYLLTILAKCYRILFLKKKERKKERNDVTVFVSYSSGCCKNPWMRPQSRYCRVVHFTSCISHSSYCWRINPASVPLIVSLWFTRWGKFASKPPKSLFQLI